MGVEVDVYVCVVPWPSGHGVHLSHVMHETVTGSNPAGAILLGMLAGWTTSNVTKGGHCGLSTKRAEALIWVWQGYAMLATWLPTKNRGLVSRSLT